MHNILILVYVFFVRWVCLLCFRIRLRHPPVPPENTRNCLRIALFYPNRMLSPHGEPLTKLCPFWFRVFLLRVCVRACVRVRARVCLLRFVPAPPTPAPVRYPKTPRNHTRWQD
jgi:hypothetical protein